MPDNRQIPQSLPPSRRGEGFHEIYSNSVNLDVTPWEFKFTFGKFVKQGDPTVISQGSVPMIVEQQVEITASPQLAKALLNLLSANMQEYEKSVGEVKLPPMGPTPTTAKQ